jgi:hypothetical protein
MFCTCVDADVDTSSDEDMRMSTIGALDKSYFDPAEQVLRRQGQMSCRRLRCRRDAGCTKQGYMAGM